MDNQNFYWILSQIHLVIFGSTILVGLVRLKKLDRLGRLFLVFLFLMFLTSFSSYYLANEGVNNLFLSFVESFFFALLVGFWFSRIFSERSKKWIAYFLATIIIATIGAEILIFQKSMSEYAALIACLTVVICASLGIHQLMSDDRVLQLSRVPHFGFMVGLLAINTFSSLFSGFRVQIMTFSSDLFIQFATIELLLQICAFLLYTYIFIKRF
jgi:hypothetical protein